MIELVLHLVLAIYLLWLLTLLVAWTKLHKEDKLPIVDSISLRYSVIIPARNEAKNLPILIKSILENDLEESSYEIIVVDDHSNDETEKELQQFASRLKYLKLTDGEGKKSALAAGIRRATGDVIITTDADCSVHGRWLRSIASYFETKDAMLVSGGVAYGSLENAFHKFQAIEFASLVGTGASSIKLRKPNMCNGANLAYTKEAFFQVNGFKGNEHLASGDDEFLMHKIAQKYPDQIYFNTYAGGEVSTRPLDTLSDFVQQRKRWASKWRHHKGIGQAVSAVFIGLVNLSVIVSLAMIFFGHFSLIVPLIIKVILETVYIKLVLRFLRVRVSLLYFILIQIIYPFYVVYFAVVVNLAGYKWKGRSY